MLSRRMRMRRLDRRGFTLLELAVVLALVAVIAGVVITQVVRRTVDGEAAALARNLDSLARGVVAFRNDVRRYPSQLSYLSDQPGTGATDSCGNPIPARFRDLWRGPYSDRLISASGVATGTSTVRDSLLRVGPPAVADTLLRITVEQVDQEVAEIVDRTFDSNASLSTGMIEWADAGGGRGTLVYSLPVRGC